MNQNLKIIFYDVEHGSCCHIITPNNKHILIDVGSKADKSIVDYINKKYFYGKGGRIDELIITHPHEDHIYDLPKLYKTLKPIVLTRPKKAFDISPSLDTEKHREIADIANYMNETYNIPVDENKLPTNASYNGEVGFEFISPKDSWTNKEDLNTFSDIIIVTYMGYKFVLTGDNPKSILQEMMDTDYCDIKTKVKNATVLLAPHHGREKEFCKDFFDCVNPFLSVISDKEIVYNTQIESSHIYKGTGVTLGDKERYVLTTRSDGTIMFEVGSNNCTVNMEKDEY